MKEPNWKAIAETLAKDVLFAINNLTSSGSGLVMGGSPLDKEVSLRHWKEMFADSLETIPGVKIDRESMYKSRKQKKKL